MMPPLHEPGGRGDRARLGQQQLIDPAAQHSADDVQLAELYAGWAA
jgi:hypothetical protein